MPVSRDDRDVVSNVEEYSVFPDAGNSLMQRFYQSVSMQ